MRILLYFSLFLIGFTAFAQESNFKSGALTAAIVVSNEQESLVFYKDILGLEEVGSFTIDAGFAKRLGLSDGEPFKVTRLAFDASTASSELKIVSFDLPKTEVESVKSKVQQQLGLQYLTLQVNSLDPIVKRAKEKGLQPEAETPIKLGENSFLILLRDPDGVFVEVIGAFSGAD